MILRRLPSLTLLHPWHRPSVVHRSPNKVSSFFSTTRSIARSSPRPRAAENNEPACTECNDTKEKYLQRVRTCAHRRCSDSIVRTEHGLQGPLLAWRNRGRGGWCCCCRTTASDLRCTSNRSDGERAIIGMRGRDFSVRSRPASANMTVRRSEGRGGTRRLRRCCTEQAKLRLEGGRCGGGRGGEDRGPSAETDHRMLLHQRRVAVLDTQVGYVGLVDEVALDSCAIPVGTEPVSFDLHLEARLSARVASKLAHILRGKGDQLHSSVSIASVSAHRRAKA